LCLEFSLKISFQIEDMNSQTQLPAAQQLSSGGVGAQTLDESGIGGADDDDDDEPPELEEVEDGPLDETGVEPKDIDILMQQANCSRAKAVRVLKESGGDLINASQFVSSFQMHVVNSSLSYSYCSERVDFLHTSYSVTQFHRFVRIHASMSNLRAPDSVNPL
jgi:NACalpha-BTF3-like transcription factor